MNKLQEQVANQERTILKLRAKCAERGERIVKLEAALQRRDKLLQRYRSVVELPESSIWK